MKKYIFLIITSLSFLSCTNIAKSIAMDNYRKAGASDEFISAREAEIDSAIDESKRIAKEQERDKKQKNLPAQQEKNREAQTSSQPNKTNDIFIGEKAATNRDIRIYPIEIDRTKLEYKKAEAINHLAIALKSEILNAELSTCEVTDRFNITITCYYDSIYREYALKIEAEENSVIVYKDVIPSLFKDIETEKNEIESQCRDYAIAMLQTFCKKANE
jgi:hypothetical protein